ncbi:protein SOGA1-like isoform X2 [Brienomyrus brachyistius]|uniref:protein SOGA1-like isoform X2 n=1 Tax=Brienomyrus brachyistius TaxID=42636 RepID=UPI0020B3CFD1|nr:protein SOGA1-like isoform X2 [Brienomyrus brachyistius]
MTKTKVDPNLVVPKLQKHAMDRQDGISSKQAQPQKSHQRQPQEPLVNEQKNSDRADLSARPKDVHVRTSAKTRGNSGTVKCSVKARTMHTGNRVSKHSPVSAKEVKPETRKVSGKTTAPAVSNPTTDSNSDGRKKVSDASDLQRKNPGCAPGKLSPADSFSSVSEGTSEENKLLTDGQSSDTENGIRDGGADRERKSVARGTMTSDQFENLTVNEGRWPLKLERGECSISFNDERSFDSLYCRHHVKATLALPDLAEFMDGVQGDLLKEIDELRSENEYLKDEIQELRSEMLEMRDAFLEEDEGQLQELRAQLERAHRTCRVLQYRLRKAERRSVRVACTGQVDGELVRALEQDIKVARDVSVRLHAELGATDLNRVRLERENQELREKVQDLEVANQVLRAEADKARENSLRKRRAKGSASKPEKTPQDDMADLKCQLHFAKEETLLMCKKLTKTAKDSESMREELAKFRSLYGNADAPLAQEAPANTPHSREAEVKVHLKLVEEEANLLSRRIVELEVENRGLRAEMEEMRGQKAEPGLEPGDSIQELRRHLRFMEEETELLRCSLAEVEEKNQQAGRRLDLEVDSAVFSKESCSVFTEASLEESVSGGCQTWRDPHEDPTLALDLTGSQMSREGPVGGEQDPQEEQEKMAEKDCGPMRPSDREAWLVIQNQTYLISSALELLRGHSTSRQTRLLPAEPLLSSGMPLASRLEALQVLLFGLLEGVGAQCSPRRGQVDGAEGSSVEPVALLQHQASVLSCPAGESAGLQMLQECMGTREWLSARSQAPLPQGPDSESQELRLLVLRLCHFLEQWRHCKARDLDGNLSPQVAGLKDLCQLLEGEGPVPTWEELSVEFYPMGRNLKQGSTDPGSTVVKLKGALQNLSAALQEEHQRSVELAQQLSQAKAIWEVERAELRGLIAQKRCQREHRVT